jgi:hypothetical protein
VVARRCSVVSLIGVAAGLMLAPVPAASADRILQSFRAGRLILDLTIATRRPVQPSDACQVPMRAR